MFSYSCKDQTPQHCIALELRGPIVKFDANASLFSVSVTSPLPVSVFIFLDCCHLCLIRP